MEILPIFMSILCFILGELKTKNDVLPKGDSNPFVEKNKSDHGLPRG